MPVTVHYVLNGVPRLARSVPAARTLLQHLRLAERQTGTKEGCAEGDCGACTVVLCEPAADGGLDCRAVNACILPFTEVAGRLVVTVEGAALGGAALHPAQTALIEHHGSQCGFCTPGIVMSLYAHERSQWPADLNAVHETLSGNLCRCTGYRPIVEAARAMGTDVAFDARDREWRRLIETMAREPIESEGEDYFAPRSLDELDRIRALHPQARILAGGTDLGVMIAKYGQEPGPLISLRHVAEMKTISAQPDVLVIGAAVSYAAALPVIERYFPAVAAIIRRIGSRQVRNLGTIGGNLCTASPIGDSAPCLIALGAELVLRSAAGRRAVGIQDFFTGYRQTALAPGEYLEAIRLPYLRGDEIFRAYKLSKRFEQDIATVAAAFRLTLADGVVTAARIGYGGMAAVPARARHLEASLLGRSLGEGAAGASAALAADFQPITDFRGSAAYRLRVAANLLRRLALDTEQPDLPSEVWSL